MTSLLTFLNLILNLITEIIKRHKGTKREEQEQLIKENPRAFFERSNRSSGTGSPDQLPDDTGN